jgi:hypothetical protein
MTAVESTTALATELEFFDQHLDEWLTKHLGRVVLVKGRELVGVFDNEDDALAEGARRFGLTSFPVRRVAPQQVEVQIPALTLGVLRANP